MEKHANVYQYSLLAGLCATLLGACAQYDKQETAEAAVEAGPAAVFPAETGKSSPYRGEAFTIPGRIAAEDYDLGGQGVGYSDNGTENQGWKEWKIDYRTDEAVGIGTAPGGFVVGWTEPGEWLNYSVNIQEAGTYQAKFHVGHGGGTAGTLRVWLDQEVILDNVEMEPTYDWSVYTTVDAGSVELPAGEYTMKVEFLTGGSGGSPGNVHWFEFLK